MDENTHEKRVVFTVLCVFYLVLVYAACLGLPNGYVVGGVGKVVSCTPGYVHTFFA